MSSRILYLIQSNLVKRDDLDRLLAALNTSGLEYQEAVVVPFSHEVLVRGQEFVATNPIVALGSTTLLNIARERRWTPGVWWDPSTFNYRSYVEHYGAHMVNADAEYATFATIPPFIGPRFIRPVDDGKAFVGEVVTPEAYEGWRDAILALHVDAFAATPVLVAMPKRLRLEYRFFVVDGKVVGGSLYHSYNRLVIQALDEANVVDRAAQQYAQARVDEWQPADAFVLDVAMLEDGTFRVVELNCLNGCGFYHSNIESILRAVDTLARSYNEI